MAELEEQLRTKLEVSGLTDWMIDRITILDDSSDVNPYQNVIPDALRKPVLSPR